MVEIVAAIVLVLALSLLLALVRAQRRTGKLRHELAGRWREVCQALERRISALEELLFAVRGAGYAPEGARKLAQALEDLKRTPRDPRALAEADERVEMALRGIYRALPRERDERVRRAQNRLAEADEELDIMKHRYNEVVFHWYELARSWSVRAVVRTKEKPEPFALPEEEGEELRRHFPAF